jgi:hypothetical protein
MLFWTGGWARASAINLSTIENLWSIWSRTAKRSVQAAWWCADERSDMLI